MARTSSWTGWIAFADWLMTIIGSIGRTEAVRPIPGTVREGRARDHEWSGMEVGELPGPAREPDDAGKGREIEDDVPERGVVARPVDDEVTVQHAASRVGRRGIDDPRADLD